MALSQRSYNAVKDSLKKKNVVLSTHVKVADYVKQLNVGVIERGGCSFPAEMCMCAKTDLKDTLLRILKSKTLLENMEFPTVEQQQNLFHQLQEKPPNFHKDLDPKKRTIFIRQTGDNYRSFRMPTQQMSFSALNLTKLINSPSGQTVECMWRGQEDRQHILGHCTSTFETLDKFAQSGIVATLHDGSFELLM